MVNVRIVMATLNFSAWLRARSGRMSHRLTSSTYGHFDSTAGRECDTLPHPITPVLIRFVSSPTAGTTPDATAGAASQRCLR